MDNRRFNIFAHPTGRLIGERAAYPIDLERILKSARERGCAIELNAHPIRLDIDDLTCRLAKDMGVAVSIGTDAHSTDGLSAMRFGVGQARRGWLEARDVLNTRPWKQLQKVLKRV
jgi:DNA polymerase (family 10)